MFEKEDTFPHWILFYKLDEAEALISVIQFKSKLGLCITLDYGIRQLLYYFTPRGIFTNWCQTYATNNDSITLA